MPLLVAVASKHGSTHDIAVRLTNALRRAGHSVDLHSAADAPDPTGYDAVLLGSAVYMGQWLGEMKDYVNIHQQALAALPVWIFSSGPLGSDNPQPEGDPPAVTEIAARLGARGLRTFAGSLQKSELSFGEKLVVRGVKAPYGDFRNWEAIDAWAAAIAAELAAVVEG